MRRMRASFAPTICAASTNSRPPQRLDLRPHDARRVEPGERADDQDQLEHTLVEQPAERPARQPVREEAADHDEEEQQRERHHEIGETRDDRVDETAEVAGERPEHDTDQQREDRRARRDLERDAAAVEDAEELVAAELAVGAEQQQRLAGAFRRRRVVERERLVVRDDATCPT